MNTSRWSVVLVSILRTLVLIIVYLITLRWGRDIVAVIRGNLEVRRRGKHLHNVRRGRPARCTPRCAVIPPDVYRRADPLIYSQRYLMDQGLAVTWDNPDIQLFENGVAVSSSSLKADTEYQVVARVWNNSTDAPAVSLPVEFAFQSFGVGAVLTPIGTTVINLPVKGAPGHPAPAAIPWRTPAAPGHYCLKVNLVWPDDANPKNNLGQENTNVGIATSPAVFRFPVRNADTIRKHVRMTVDAYALPAPVDCRERPPKKEPTRRDRMRGAVPAFVPPLEEAADWTSVRARHAVEAFPIPPGWSARVDPAEFVLAPDQTEQVTVTITPPDEFRGERPFNVNAMHGAALLGGVTLIVRK